MASFKLICVFLALLCTAKARFVDTERVQDFLKGTGDFTDDDACQDCIHIIELLKDLISDGQFQEDVQEKLKGLLEKLCDSLPGEIPKMCREQVDKNLPLAITFISSIMNPGEVCAYLGLCDGQLRGQMKELIMNHMQKIVVLPDITVNSSIPCTLCTYLTDLLQCIIPKTQTLLISLLGDACQILPPLVRGQCTILVKTYVKMLINFLLNFASPDQLCSVLRLCQNMEFPQTDCDSCLTLAVLTRLSLGTNATEPQAASFLRTVCQSHPDALPKCESFTQHHASQLQGLLGKEMAALQMCETAGLCEDQAGSDAADDPCTLGRSYSCRNLQTAQMCGVVAFCQQNVWN